MWNPQTMELMPGFWPPKPSRFWNIALEPVRKHYLHRFYGISSVEIVGAEKVRGSIAAGHGVLVTPNHCRDEDPFIVSALAKWKTTFQLVSLGALIFGGAFPGEPWIHLIGLASLWIAAGLTMITGYDYMRIGLRHMD